MQLSCTLLLFYFAPSASTIQIRRSLLNEDEYGFRKAKRPIYYDDDDDGLEVNMALLPKELFELFWDIDITCWHFLEAED